MSCPIKYSTAEVIAASKKGGLELEKVINHVIEVLYQCRSFVGTVYRHVKKNRGNQQDGEDVLQEGLIQLAINLAKDKFKGGSSIENYAFGICRNKWLNEIYKKRREKEIFPGKDIGKNKIAPENPEEDLLEEERIRILREIIKKLTGNCPRLLIYRLLKFSHKEISEEMGINVQTSRNETSKCLKKLRNFINDDPDLEKLLRGL